MKKLISVVLVLALLVSMTACAKPQGETAQSTEATEMVLLQEPAAATHPAITQPATEVTEPTEEDTLLEFTGLNDPVFLQYIEDSLSSGMDGATTDDGYSIENVEVIYISKEYIEELEYNSQANIFFGYTLAELDEQYQGTRYVFTLGEDGQTSVQPFEAYDDSYEQMLKNVAIGAGTVLSYITVCYEVDNVEYRMVVNLAIAAKDGAMKEVHKMISNGDLAKLVGSIAVGVITKDYTTAQKMAVNMSKNIVCGAISGMLAETQ